MQTFVSFATPATMPNHFVSLTPFREVASRCDIGLRALGFGNLPQA